MTGVHHRPHACEASCGSCVEERLRVVSVDDIDQLAPEVARQAENRPGSNPGRKIERGHANAELLDLRSEHATAPHADDLDAMPSPIRAARELDQQPLKAAGVEL